MANEAISMTFAAIFTAQVESHDLPGPSVRAAFHIPAPTAETRPVTAHMPGTNDPSRRLLPPPVNTINTEEPSRLSEMKRDRRYPRMVWLEIANPRTRTDGFVQLALEKVFRENADIAARLAGNKRKIHEGPFTREIAEVKKRQVRDLAKAEEKPAPRIALIEQKHY